MSSIVVPENVAKNIEFEFDPKASVTYVEDRLYEERSSRTITIYTS
mgnify:CR=1 FL=1